MRVFWAILILALGACRDEVETETNRVLVEQSRQTFRQELEALPESGRNLAFRNAIRDVGLKCERVDRSRNQESVEGGEMWVAHCTDIGDVALFVSQAGYAQIRRCVDLKGSEAPPCKS